VKQHGQRFQATVVLRGPSGRLVAVRLRIQSNAGQDRVLFAGVGWRAFVLENELQVGHQLLFSLVSKSIFEVCHLEPNHRIIRTPNVRSTCHGLDFPPKVPEMSVEPSGESFAMMKSDVVYGSGTSRVKDKVDSLVGSLQCPHFVTKSSLVSPGLKLSAYQPMKYTKLCSFLG
jgi:hypothetical protein